ncbi:polysaccharide biosynthesis/export family protein [Pseudomonas sp. CCI3.1]|uniref:polysaccharide biosynthesis/export family protein n=1 Tax=Pseudomonas sp. CCI3.1 TaxID=3048618 RepID=UPI002AB52959|nr:MULTISPECIES: polysaccharide biosynthesis/export family protein [unclassified Pseudomonas]MDY7584990.1 polysaccharide biosynthesis/export family protein [Pseudomonas sp. CCI3.1]MEB0066291.1 polysaccharide biosynthesis/export family protein [Pseudomonas sp. CCI3.1]MEB0071609.1 polysaccharide biosynthesis/export family protein [Pseudomonas sp. CCI1.4]
MIRSLSLAVLAGFALQGCMFAPGQYLDTSEIGTEGSPESSRVELIPITPKLIAQNAATHVSSSVPAELLAFKPAAYRIGANDVLYITVWDHPELTAPSGAQQQIDANGRLVRPDGTIFYPYIGKLDAAGKTIEELRSTIAQRLAQYVDSPQVDLSVLRFASQKAILAGAVVKAGPMPITTSPMSVIEAIGAAGIEPLNADLSGLTLTRDGKEYVLDIDALNTSGSQLHNVFLKDGDQLYLPYNDRKKIYVMGEVLAPQAIRFKTKNMSLADVVGSVGGLNQTTSNGNALYVIRGAENIETEPAKVFQLDAESPVAFAIANRFELKPQDIVYVGPAQVTRWNRLISQLLPSATILGTGAAAGNNLSEANSR